MTEYRTLQDLVWAAYSKLPRDVWEYVTYGTETDSTLFRNRQALDSLAWMPRVLRDVSDIDVRGSFLGQALRIPVILAPIGSIGRFDPREIEASAPAVRDFGVMQIVSSYADPETGMAPRKTNAPLIFALHPEADTAMLDDLVDRINDSGYRGISFATNSAYYSRRERDLINGLASKVVHAHTYASYMQQQRSELAAGKVPTKEGLRSAAVTWDLFERVVQRSKIPVVVKGIQTAADARLAVEHGAAAIYVSNNGGRGLDHARAAIQILPDVVGAVAGKLPIIVDGGFVRGSDVLKAIALGATAVCMGRLQAWSLAADGEAGLLRMLEILEEEMIITMGQLGATRLSELSPELLAAVPPPVLPHPLAAFPVVMERIARAGSGA